MNIKDLISEWLEENGFRYHKSLDTIVIFTEGLKYVTNEFKGVLHIAVCKNHVSIYPNRFPLFPKKIIFSSPNFFDLLMSEILDSIKWINEIYESR